MFLGARHGTIAGITAPTAGVQYSEASTLTIAGTGFSKSTVIRIDGVTYTTTYVSPTQVTVPIPTARTAGSPLRTAGTKVITTNSGGSVNWTVDAWSEIDEAACTGLWIASSANLGGVTVYDAQITTWTDLAGVEDLVGAGATRPVYCPANDTTEPGQAWTVPSVVFHSDFNLARTAQTINGGDYFYVLAFGPYIGGGDRQAVGWAGNFRRALKPSAESYVRVRDIPNGGGTTASVDVTYDAGWSASNRSVLSVRKTGTTFGVTRDAAAETTATGDTSSGTGGALTMGSASGTGMSAAYFATFSEDPGATVRHRARNKAMILTGLA